MSWSRMASGLLHWDSISSWGVSLASCSLCFRNTVSFPAKAAVKRSELCKYSAACPSYGDTLDSSYMLCCTEESKNSSLQLEIEALTKKNRQVKLIVSLCNPSGMLSLWNGNYH